MASWKGIYRNVEEFGGEEKRSEPDTTMCFEEWSEYEEIDPAAKRDRKQMKPRSAAWRAPCTRKTVVICSAAVLAASVFLNVMLLALGIVHYSKDSTLEHVHRENKVSQEKTAACIFSAWNWIFIQDSYYFLSHSPGTWDVANQSCTSMESHLVMIDSAEEKGRIANIMKASSYWIGLTDNKLDGDWRWVDGTRFGPDYMSYWHKSEPNGGRAENCAIMMKSSFWYDYPCTDKHHWICERKR